MLKARPLLLVGALVFQKCATDALTWYTRAHSSTHYSGSSVALLCEVLKFPVLAVAVAVFDSPKAVLPTFRGAVTQAPFALAWVGAAYAAQNVLYFRCLDYISAGGYQVLSQSKLIFTAGLMRVMLQKRFSYQQLAALALLVGGACVTQLAEASHPTATGASSGKALLGSGLTVLSALLAALPNVFYERLLKSNGQSEWVVNLQLTGWIFVWVAVAKVLDGGAVGLTSGTAGVWMSWQGLVHWYAELTAGFSPGVWFVILLKTLNCIIIPACLKYADNIAYGYAKPASIILTTAATAAMTVTLPSPTMLAGIVMVLASMALYGKG